MKVIPIPVQPPNLSGRPQTVKTPSFFPAILLSLRPMRRASGTIQAVDLPPTALHSSAELWQVQVVQKHGGFLPFLAQASRTSSPLACIGGQEQVCSEMQNGRKDVAEFADNSGNRRSASAAPPEFCANSATNAFLRPRIGARLYLQSTVPLRAKVDLTRPAIALHAVGRQGLDATDPRPGDCGGAFGELRLAGPQGRVANGIAIWR